jgi:glutathione S-transferase
MFPDRPFNYEQMKAAIPAFKDQWRAHADFVEAQLSDGRKFLHGEVANVDDAHCYMNFWFLKSFFAPTADALLKEFPKTSAWYSRVTAIGHGTHTPMDSKDALGVAKATNSPSEPRIDEHDPNGRKPGDRVSVMPDDYGRDPVTGELVFSTAQEIAIKRHDPTVGDVVVHFPRAGFLVVSA